MNDIILDCVEFVKSELKETESGHDWSHIERVWTNAKKINTVENADSLIVELAALLHDIADAKFHDGDETVGPKKARQFLTSQNLDEGVINTIIFIIENMSYRGGFNEHIEKPLEYQIVQDADRLDAIGAIGVARAFSYGGYKGLSFYDPDISPTEYQSKEAYKSSKAPTLNHFYEKLFKLKDLMNTRSGKSMAEERHQFMMTFIEQFKSESYLDHL